MSKIPFGKHKGMSLESIPDNYLVWLAKQKNTDLDYWASLAEKELKERNNSNDLEAVADDFLRQYGYDINGT